MRYKDGHAEHATALRVVLSLLVVAGCVAALGVGPAATAQAAPDSQVELGLGSRTVETDSTDVPAAVKAAELIDDGTEVDEMLGGRSVRKPTPIRAVAPARRSGSGAARGSGSGWQSARVSWYGPGFYGNTMAGGGTLTRESMVVAHRSLPFGTRIQFQYNGRSTTAVVMDRGPYVGGRAFDLGPGTARALGFGGVGTVRYRILGR